VGAGGRSPDEFEQRAAEVGYPLAMKIDAPELSHKTDKGGVAVGVADAARVRQQLDVFTGVARAEGLSSPDVLLQKMVSGIEVLVGLKRDPSFGLLLVLGVGGIQAELFPDVRAVLLPTTRVQLEAAVSSHPILEQLLRGFRGGEAANREALVDLVERFAAWGLAWGDRLEEAEINPVMVNAVGAVAVDARAVIGDVSQ
jgi:acetyltransferase